MSLLELQSLLDKVIPIVKEAGTFIKNEQGKVTAEQIEDKALNSLVSYVDKQAEAILVKGLEEILPTATFVTEEDTMINQVSALTWIIDPLDGTTNFLHGIPHYSVSVALQKEAELVLGVVYQVVTEECFYAVKDGGAFLNGKPIRVSTSEKLSATVVATGFPLNNSTQLRKKLDTLESLLKQVRGIRRFGSAALDLAFVAAGRYDAYFEWGINAWDVAGGIVLVQEAGGIVTDFQQRDDYLFGRNIIASNGSIHQNLSQVIK